MNRNDEFEKIKREYREIQIPESGKKNVEISIVRAKSDKIRKQKRKMYYNLGVAIAAVVALVILPNTSPLVAQAMEQLPIVGGLFEVITIRNYTFEDEFRHVDVEVPFIVEPNSENGEKNVAVQSVNKSVEEYVDEMLADFETTMQQEGYHGLDIAYEIITDTESWFTLRIDVVDTQASGYQTQKFYHIDKTTGKKVQIEDLFIKDSNYVDIISEEIIRQMQEQMKGGEIVYFIEDDGIVEPFRKISEDQNFYFNKEGELVIVFGEYEVGPGCIGCPEFTISEDILKDEWKQ